MPDERAFPMDVTDRPWKFRPDGHLVLILRDEDDARRAADLLTSAGFAGDAVKTYTAEDTLANHARYRAQRSAADRLIGTVTDDDESRQAYLGYANDGRSALWLRVSEDDAAKAMRAVADVPYLHARHYGSRTTDYRTRTD